MRTVVHLSDLHFGRVDCRVLEPLAAAVRRLGPQVVCVSGDLTQRARAREFREARDFLNRLPRPQIVVPGNHDVPLDNVVARFLRPLDCYRRYITEDLEPFYTDEEIVVAGVNTARSLTWKGGRINALQVATVYGRLCTLDESMTKIVVTHHPFDLPEAHGPRELVGRAGMAMKRMAMCGADVFLAGHLHIASATHTAARYKIAGYAALVVQAGTATSTRGRGELNSFNVLRIEHPAIAVERHEWDSRAGEFTCRAREMFRHIPGRGWSPGEPMPPSSPRRS